MLRVALIVVEFTTLKVPAATETPPPETVNEVAPVRLVPVRVTGTLVPRTPVLGAIEVRVGPCTVNVTLLLVAGPTETLTFLAEALAEAEIPKVAVTVVLFTTVICVTVIPPPFTFTAVVPVRPVPVRVTPTLVPFTPVLGLIEVRVGVTVAVTVNVTALLVAAPTETVTLLALVLAPFEIAKLAVTTLSLTTLIPVTVMPEPAFTAVVPVRLVPLSVTATLLPLTPEVGAIEVSVGDGTTVKLTLPLVPPSVLTVTVLAPVVALLAIANVAVTVVSFTT